MTTATTTTEITKLLPKRPARLSWMDSRQGVVDHGYSNYRTFTILGYEVEVVKQQTRMACLRSGRYARRTLWTAFVEGRSIRCHDVDTYKSLRLYIARHIARLLRSEAS